MEDTKIELLLGREMPYTGHKRLPQRSIIGPFGKDFVDGRVMHRRWPVGVVTGSGAVVLLSNGLMGGMVK